MSGLLTGSFRLSSLGRARGWSRFKRGLDPAEISLGGREAEDLLVELLPRSRQPILDEDGRLDLERGRERLEHRGRWPLRRTWREPLLNQAQADGCSGRRVLPRLERDIFERHPARAAQLRHERPEVGR